MKHYTDCQDEYDVSVLLMPTCINGLKKLAESFNATEEEYLLALGDLADCFFHYVNTDEAPKLKTPLSQIAFEFAKEQARQSANRYKTGKTNGKKGVEAKKQKADAKRAKEATKAKQAEQLNTVKPEPEDTQTITNSDKSKEQTVLGSHQLQKKQQPQKQQQLQKEQQLGKSQQLDWQCVAGLELTEQQQQEAIRIRKTNNPGNSKEAKKIQTFTQASLKQFLTQVKHSVDAGISIDEVLEVWEGKQWRSWTHSYYSKEIASDIKAQSQTAKDLKRVQASQESVKDNDWDNFEITPLVKDLVQFSINDKIEQTNKGGNNHG